MRSLTFLTLGFGVLLITGPTAASYADTTMTEKDMVLIPRGVGVGKAAFWSVTPTHPPPGP